MTALGFQPRQCLTCSDSFSGLKVPFSIRLPEWGLDFMSCARSWHCMADGSRLKALKAVAVPSAYTCLFHSTRMLLGCRIKPSSMTTAHQMGGDQAQHSQPIDYPHPHFRHCPGQIRQITTILR